MCRNTFYFHFGGGLYRIYRRILTYANIERVNLEEKNKKNDDFKEIKFTCYWASNV